VFIAFSPIAKPVVTTMSILRTQSQVRSLQGRVNTWTTALEMARSRPLLGIGSYNFPMQYVAYRPANTVYVSRALNLFLQILIERGVLGLVVFGFLLFSFFKTSFRQLGLNEATVFERSVIAVFIAACAAAIIRDLSYFSILSNKGVATLLCLMFACNASLPLSPSKLLPAKKSPVGFFSILVLITFVFISLKYSHVLRNESDDNAYYVSNKALLLTSTLTRDLDPETIRQHRIEFGEEERSRIQQAVVLYNRALELNPADDVFHHNLGWLHYFLGQTQLAIKHIRRSIELSSDVALYHVSLGLIYESTGEADRASSEYTFALRLSPGLVDSAFFKDFQNRLPAEAEKALQATTSYFEEQLASGSDPIANAGLGKLYLYEGRVDEAIKRLQDATAQLPSLPLAWINLGQCYELTGNESEAKLAYERALFLDDGNYSALDHLGDLAYQQQQPAQAIAYYERALNRFQRQSSIHSERVLRIYRAKQIVANDIVPARLLAYAAPAFDRSEVYVRLTLLHRAKEHIDAAQKK
jgi:tetratricopeptide (TPR) repeat protein